MDRALLTAYPIRGPSCTACFCFLLPRAPGAVKLGSALFVLL